MFARFLAGWTAHRGFGRIYINGKAIFENHRHSKTTIAELGLEGDGVELEELHESRVEQRAPAYEILAVNEPLDELAAREPVTARIVKLRYFVGMTVPEIAEALELSVSTVERHWTYARAWLRSAVRSGD